MDGTQGLALGSSEYELMINHPKSKIVDIFIDPSYYMADIDRENNTYFNQPNEKHGLEKLRKVKLD